MALMEALARLDAVLDRTLELTVSPSRKALLVVLPLTSHRSHQGHAPAPMGPFTAAFHTPAGLLLRDAEPGEREMFAYVG